MAQAVMESAARTEAVMVRQNGERIVHFAGDDDEPMCRIDYRDPRATTTDAREVTCGKCLRRPEWRQAWKEAAKRKMPAR